MPSTSQDIAVHEDDVGNEVLVEEIESRPFIYDKSLKDYSKSNLKIKAWDEVSAEVFLTIWGKLSKEKKTEAGKILQMWWKNIRVCFATELREKKCIKSGRAATIRKKFRYFEKLLFLTPNLETRKTTGNISAPDEEHDQSEEDAYN